MNKISFAFLGLVCACLFATIGCAPKAPYSLVEISGVASYQGTPLPEGFRVEFEPTDGSRPSFVIIQPGGKFELVHTASQKGAKVGTCKIRVYWNENPQTNPAPEEYQEMLSKYGMTGEDAPEVEVSKKDKDFKVNFE